MGTMRATNFKASVRDKALHAAYVDVWRRMAKLQPVPPYGGRAVPARTR
ncbi:MAG: hypothetical protein GX086_06350 [Alcaligenaceae bacterium]|nr:hypothetical protein [Alcaligenaceae bacterium]